MDPFLLSRIGPISLLSNLPTAGKKGQLTGRKIFCLASLFGNFLSLLLSFNYNAQQIEMQRQSSPITLRAFLFIACFIFSKFSSLFFFFSVTPLNFRAFIPFLGRND